MTCPPYNYTHFAVLLALLLHYHHVQHLKRSDSDDDAVKTCGGKVDGNDQVIGGKKKDESIEGRKGKQESQSSAGRWGRVKIGGSEFLYIAGLRGGP